MKSAVFSSDESEQVTQFTKMTQLARITRILFQTPLTRFRAYPAALVLFEAAQRVAAESSNDAPTQRKTLMSMVFPPGAPADNSPLHVICCNDTCSFTWTGAEHINQDIFECREEIQ